MLNFDVPIYITLDRKHFLANETIKWLFLFMNTHNVSFQTLFFCKCVEGGAAIKANPEDACTGIEPPPSTPINMYVT